MGERILDLTRTLGPSTPVPAWLDPPRLRPLFELGSQPSSIQELTVATHVGTHIDAPRHFLPDGPSIDELPPALFWAPCVIVDARREQPGPLTLPELESKLRAVAAGDAVFLATGWEHRWGTSEYADWPWPTEELACWLVDREVCLFGMDTAGVDLPPPRRSAGPDRFTFPIHRTLLRAGIPIVENLCNLGPIMGQRVVVVAAPLKIAGGDGSPARVLARVPDLSDRSAGPRQPDNQRTVA